MGNKCNANGIEFNEFEIENKYIDQVTIYRNSLLEAISDYDDNIAEKYIENKIITESELQIGIRKATLALNFIPVIPGSAFRNKGIQMLLDSVINYLPSPIDLLPIQGKNKKSSIIRIQPDDNSKIIGLILKLMTDPYVGKL